MTPFEYLLLLALIVVGVAVNDLAVSLSRAGRAGASLGLDRIATLGLRAVHWRHCAVLAAPKARRRSLRERFMARKRDA